MIKKFDDLTVVEFGNGTVTVELGKYGSQYAVFINNTDTPGMPGQLAPKTKNPRGYEPDEIVLVFPTKKRAAGVVNSLFNGELVKVEGRQHPAPAVQGEPVGWQFYQDGKWWNGDDRIKDHRKNTEEAGLPVRDVYAVQQAVTVPEIIKTVAEFVGSQKGGPFTPAVIKAAILGQLEHGDAFTKLLTLPAPQPAEQPECGCCGQTVKCDDDCDAVVIGGHRTAEQQPAPEVAMLVAALEKARDAIASLPKDALGNVPDTQQYQGWHIRDELINDISTALATYRNQGGAI